MATVQGTYVKPDGSPASGTVRFTLFPPAASTGTPVVQYTGSFIDVDLDSTGAFSVSLVSDDLLVVDGDSLYRVDEVIDGLTRTWPLFVPTESSIIDLPTAYGDAVGALGNPTSSSFKGDQGEVAVGATTTGAPGSPALVTDTDPSPSKAVLDFVIPQGLPGISSAWSFNWRVDAATPPGNGNFKTDTADPDQASLVYVSAFDKSGSIALGLVWLKAGDLLYVYELNSAAILSYRATADAVNHDDLWLEIAVELVEDQGFSPSNNKPIDVAVRLFG